MAKPLKKASPAAIPSNLEAAKLKSPRLEAHPGGALYQLDRLIHERLRLGILSALAVNASLTFTDLRSMLATTDGNLSVHARRLEEAGYVECIKSFEGRLPKTTYKLTSAGRKALGDYLDRMEALIHTMRG